MKLPQCEYVYQSTKHRCSYAAVLGIGNKDQMVYLCLAHLPLKDWSSWKDVDTVRAAPESIRAILEPMIYRNKERNRSSAMERTVDKIYAHAYGVRYEPLAEERTQGDKMIRKFAAASTIALLLLAGCARNPNANPQLQAAINNDRASLALNTFCKQFSNYRTFVDASVVSVVGKKCIQLATLDDQVTNAIAANDLTTAGSQLQLGIGVAQSIGTDLLNIKDTTTQQVLLISQTAVVTALTSWQAVIAVKTTGGTK